MNNLDEALRSVTGIILHYLLFILLSYFSISIIFILTTIWKQNLAPLQLFYGICIFFFPMFLLLALINLITWMLLYNNLFYVKYRLKIIICLLMPWLAAGLIFYDCKWGNGQCYI